MISNRQISYWENLMTRQLSDYDTLECLRCGGQTEPAELKPDQAVRYVHHCDSDHSHGWTIDKDGDIKNEITI